MSEQLSFQFESREQLVEEFNTTQAALIRAISRFIESNACDAGELIEACAEQAQDYLNGLGSVELDDMLCPGDIAEDAASNFEFDADELVDEITTAVRETVEARLPDMIREGLNEAIQSALRSRSVGIDDIIETYDVKVAVRDHDYSDITG